MSLFYEVKKKAYGETRRVSNGAAVTLLCKSGEYHAMFECAKRCADVLGHRNLEETLDGILESALRYKIPMEEMPGALEKLSRRFSVALVDLAYEKGKPRFVLVWKIERTKAGIVEEQNANAEKALEEIFGDSEQAKGRDLMAEFEAEQEQPKAPVSVDDF